MTTDHDPGQIDQARTPWFRILLFVQLAASAWFGLFPFFAPRLSADAAGYAGSDPFVYRQTGAATLGYAVAAAAALLAPAWHRFRIPAAAAYVFNAGAVVATLLSVLEGDRNFWVLFILVAAAVFVVVIAFVTRRDLGPPAPADPMIDRPARILLAIASLAAAVFGLLPLFLAPTMIELTSLGEGDVFVVRLAGAATFGYAFGGYLSLRSGRWEAIRLQNLAAITFNALAATAGLIYVTSGGDSPVVWLILVAATVFAVGLALLHARRGRLGSRAV
ncbi:MAG TPA: hypothetical protein VIA81_01980 [Acidimicrobiia bacterium]|jgi:hypothetical protein